MKIAFRSTFHNQGSILFATLILAIAMGMTICSYLVLTAGQEGSVSRSQRWNTALNVAEAGIEEGLAQVNATPNDFSVNGWPLLGTNNYGPQIRSMSNGKYSVIIQSGSTPTIYSTGSVTAPITGTVIKRTVRVTTQALPLFNVGLGAVGNINMNGNSMATDSWNSMSTNLSNNGVYSSSKTSTNGDVASVQGIVNIGNHTINGNLYLGPTATYVNGTNQILGDLDKNYNVNFPDVVLPSATGISPTSTGGTNYLLLSDTTYTINNGDANKPIVVAQGLTNVTLIAKVQDFNPTSITLLGGMTNSASLIIYDAPPSSGGTITLNGNNTGGAIGNRPVNFILLGTPNLTSITFGGKSDFIGAIYAPEAVFTLNGGGSGMNVLGAAIVKTVTLNGHYDVHYDEALASLSLFKSYVVNSWQEL